MRVNYEEKMLTDPRFKKLGHRLHISHFEAFGRLLPVWCQAYHRRDASMASDDIDALAELEGFAAALLGADLATEADGGRLRLRGVEGHIEWLLEQDRKRELAAEARRAKPRKVPRESHGKENAPVEPPRDIPREDPRDVPLTLDLLSLSPDLRSPASPELPDPPAIVRAERPASQQQRDRRIKLNHDAWQYAASAHAKLRGEGISPDAIPWPAIPSGAAQSDLVERVKELLVGDPPDFVAAVETLRRRIDVAAAEAKREQHLRWFTPTRVWDAKSFWRAIEQTPAEAAQPRAPARAGPNARAAPDEPVRKIPTFR